jgi:PhnB protein
MMTKVPARTSYQTTKRRCAVAGIPEGFRTITPQIHVSNGDKAIALYKKALSAKELHRMLAPGTKTIMHACIEIGSSKLFLSDHAGQPQPPKGANSSFYVYVENIDAAHKKAVSAGRKESMPPTDMFWGDRMSAVTDPFGHSWNLATFKRQMPPDEMMKAMKEQFGGAMAEQKKPSKRATAKK